MYIFTIKRNNTILFIKKFDNLKDIDDYLTINKWLDKYDKDLYLYVGCL